LLARVVDQQPANAQALTALAELLASRGAFDEAAARLNQAAESTAAVGPRLALAQLRIRQGNLVAARQDVELAVQAAPEDPNVVAVQGILALVEGRAQEAATLLQRAAAGLPNRLGITLALARAQLASGSAGEAKTTLQRVIERAPRSLPLRLALGQVELQLGNAAEAVMIANALKAEFPTQSSGYLLEADAQMVARRYSSAAGTLAAAYEREATWRVLARYVGALQLANQQADAVRVTQEWIAVNPAHVPAKLLLAGLLQQEGRNEDALQSYQAVLGLEPDNIAALNNAAWLSRELSRPGALDLAEKAHALAGDNAAVLDTLGWILIAENRESEAVTHLSRAAELAPGAPEIRYHLAAALAAVGRGAEARAQLTSLLEGNADFPQRDEARRLRDSL
jgi:putative PEP-CTERM system TPR-repeat lipoprotein